MSDLVKVKTSDGIELHGLFYDTGQKDKAAVILLHGVARNFYSEPLPKIAETISKAGYSCITANTRGHDWIAPSPGSDRWMGAAFEIMSESAFDIEAFIRFLTSYGYNKVALLGHSLGAPKIFYYQKQRRDPTVRALIALSPANLSYKSRIGRVPGFEESYKIAEKYLAEGRRDALIRIPSPADWESDTIFSAETFVDKYKQSSGYDTAENIGDIDCPTLICAGSKEMALKEFATSLSNPEMKRTVELIEGASHFYLGCESLVGDKITSWLKVNVK
jgi:pimeloyl-ACP methyl ester carboxylesterase